MKPILLMIVNDAAFFLSHRLPIAEGARNEGYDVHVATQAGPSVAKIQSLGFTFHELKITRSGKNPLGELLSLVNIVKLCWSVRPDVLHLVTIKPVLYGGIAARLSPVKGVLAAISGLGFIFMKQGRKAALIRGVVSTLYRLALGKRNVRVVFQNPDDQQALIDLGAVTAQKSVLIKGSGVDLDLYQCDEEPAGPVVVTLAARLLKDKGVLEFVEAAQILRGRGVEAVFQLVGDPDPGNPTSIDPAQLQTWAAGDLIQCLGYRSDIANVFRASNIVVLPSYREGLPKVLIEAAACGRAVVTTNVPGCRDAIVADVTGLLVPVRDSQSLADAIQRLVEDAALRRSMGLAGRAFAEQTFAIQQVVGKHMEIYRTLRSQA